jgi:hypothetical protein
VKIAYPPAYYSQDLDADVGLQNTTANNDHPNDDVLQYCFRRPQCTCTALRNDL